MPTLRSSSMELRDNAGTTVQYKDAVTAGSPVTLSSGTLKIDEFIVRNNDEDETLLLKMGASTDDWCIEPCGDYLIWTPKGSIASITLEPASGTIEYQAIINYADC